MQKLAKLIAVACLALAGLATAAAHSAQSGAGAAGGPLELRVTARISGKFVSPAGTEPPGFDVDILRRFAAWHKVRSGQEAHLAFSYSSTVAPVLEAVQKGTADLGVGGITATAERAKLVDFSTATLPVRSVLVAPPGILDAKRWREQLKGGLRLGATVGSTNAAEVDRVAASLAGVRTNTSFASNEAVFAALGGARQLDAALVDLPQYWTNGKQKGLVLVDSVGQPQTMAIVLRKGSPLRTEVDQFLEGFTHSTDYFQLIRRYFGGDAEQMVRLSRGQT
ncbi:MAG TPA: transporter substrate-binding domain-containing protein [Thermoanaerobaculia bacterium]|jgi:polar amino acid transport system substrate-binding protein|nr:transporter substrate-binding domain-containing protein [Thermoanaerobaculia bacterium]